jgi:predicted RNase H-like HicB family nuclease
MRCFVMIRRTPTGYSVDVPDLPGCVAAARTVEQSRRLIAEAIALHVDLMKQSGETIPAPRQRMEILLDEEDGEAFCTWVDVPDIASIPA